MWKEIKQIYAWGGVPTSGMKKHLNQGLLFFYSEKGVLTLYSDSNLQEINIDLAGARLPTTVLSEILIIFGNTLKTFNSESKELSVVCETKHEEIKFVFNEYYVASTKVRDPIKSWKILSEESYLVRISDNKLLYKWNIKGFIPLALNKNIFIFNDRNSNSVLRLELDSSSNNELWRYQLEDNPPIPRFTQIVENILVISLYFIDEISNSAYYQLLGLDIESGAIKWRLEDEKVASWYHYNENNKKLYSIQGYQEINFQVVNPLTGEIEFEKDLSVVHKNMEVSSQCASIAADNILYFGSNTRYPKGRNDYDYLGPHVCSINTLTYEVGELIDISVDMKSISHPSRALNNPPFVFNSRLYIHDLNKYLHILEREKKE